MVSAFDGACRSASRSAAFATEEEKSGPAPPISASTSDAPITAASTPGKRANTTGSRTHSGRLGPARLPSSVRSSTPEAASPCPGRPSGTTTYRCGPALVPRSGRGGGGGRSEQGRDRPLVDLARVCDGRLEQRVEHHPGSAGLAQPRERDVALAGELLEPGRILRRHRPHRP